MKIENPSNEKTNFLKYKLTNLKKSIKDNYTTKKN